MKIIVDTNVLVSGIFFPKGPPRQILQTWKKGKSTLVISPEIFDEYSTTFQDLKSEHPSSAAEASVFLELVLLFAKNYQTEKLPESVCDDPDDDMFIACALASGTKTIVSGDKRLLKVSGYQDIEVLKPSVFVEQYLKRRKV